MTLFRALFLACCAVAACGSPVIFPQRDSGPTFGGGGGGTGSTGGGRDAGSADAGLPLRVACSTLNAARCDFLRRCGLIDDDLDAYRTCIGLLTTTWCGPTKWISRVDVGTLRYDPETAQRCATDWSRQACANWETEPTSCKQFLLPALSFGDRCYDGYQECSDGVCRGGGCPRTCTAQGTVGEACRTSADCVSSLYCRPPASPAGISQCTAFSPETTPCGMGQQCAAGLFCSQGVCRRLPSAPNACLAGRCDARAFCLTSADGGQCEPRRDAGLACADDSQCQESLVCSNATSVCVPLAVPKLADPCTLQQTCPAGAICLMDAGSRSGTCQAARALNESCSAATDCEAHLTCGDRDGGRACVNRRMSGTQCITSRDCRPTATCLNGHCELYPVVGQRCSTALPCQWGACLDQGDGGALCIEPQGPGQRCRAGTDCGSGRCEQGLCAAACLP